MRPGPAADTTVGFHYAYDSDNNGSFDSGNSSYASSGAAALAIVPASFLSTLGTHPVGGRIIDKDGDFTDYTITNTTLVAVNDSYQTTRNTAPLIDQPGVLGSDTDAEDNPLTAAVVGQPAHGALLLTSDGAFNLHLRHRLCRQRRLHLLGQQRAVPLECDHGEHHGQRYAGRDRRQLQRVR